MVKQADSSILIYPALNSNIQLHWQPSCLLARIPPLPEQGLHPEIYELNETASRLLLLCDGTRRYDDILRTVAATLRHDSDNPVTVAGDLYLDLARKRIVGFHDAPVSVKITITGSKEYFSPSHFAIELTSECNLKCGHCYRECEPGKGTRLPTQTLMQIIRDMAGHGVTSLELTGGEPTIHPDFFAILDYCCSNFTNVAILSNGWMIDDAFAARTADRQSPPFVQIDLDGCDAATHDELRGVKGSFNNALRAIAALKKYGIRVRAAMNVHKGNISQLEATLELARVAGADWFAISPLMLVGKGRQMQALTPDEYGFLSDKADQFAVRYPKFFFLSREIESRINGTIDNCGAGSRAMVLGSNGVVRPCLLLDDRYIELGDLTELSSSGSEPSNMQWL
jgi:MoaA/NifB/PqqE/SkfB family radical SAM enzyme